MTMQRQTRQKKILEGEMGSFESFFDADELHATASRRDRGIGIATIYRFLKHKVEWGELHSYLCDKRKIYSTNKNNHSHFTCKSCGERQHIKAAKLDFLAEDWNVCHVQIDVTGICKECSMCIAS